MENVTLLNYDYSKWGIVQEGILGSINTYGTTVDYNNFSEESMLNILSTLSMNRSDNREFILQTSQYGFEQFNQALREQMNNYAR